MSKYTMQLREIYSPTIHFATPFYTKDEVIGWFEDYELSDYLTQDEIDIINARGTWNKHKLATKIVNHYFMREIGFETIGLFREQAKHYMSEIMEEYLPLIYSSSIEYDPLVNVDYTESYNREATNEGENNGVINGTINSNSSGNSTSSSNSSGLNVSSDTPQGQINKTSILNGAYASSTNANENSISDTTTTSSNNSNASNTTENRTNSNTLNEEYTKRVKGNSGVSATAQRMIQQYRDNIRAIDKEIIEKCECLFMAIYF